MTIAVARFSERALGALVQECEDKKPYETGGILIGRMDGHELLVVKTVGPGPKALHARAAFRRDGAYAQGELDRIYNESGGELDYVGEWHSHLLPVGPSDRDRRSMRWIANHPGYALAAPVLVIVQLCPEPRWLPVAFQWQRDSLAAIPIASRES